MHIKLSVTLLFLAVHITASEYTFFYHHHIQGYRVAIVKH